jgi:hypothetical protein
MRPQITQTYDRINEFLSLMVSLRDQQNNIHSNVPMVQTTQQHSSVPVVSGLITGIALIGMMVLYEKQTKI